MQVTDIRIGFDNLLAIKFKNQSKLTVGRRVLRTEVDHHSVIVSLKIEVFEARC
jgi:hypothetical protein